MGERKNMNILLIFMLALTCIGGVVRQSRSHSSAPACPAMTMGCSRYRNSAQCRSDRDCYQGQICCKTGVFCGFACYGDMQPQDVKQCSISRKRCLVGQNRCRFGRRICRNLYKCQRHWKQCQKKTGNWWTWLGKFLILQWFICITSQAFTTSRYPQN